MIYAVCTKHYALCTVSYTLGNAKHYVEWCIEDNDNSDDDDNDDDDNGDDDIYIMMQCLFVCHEKWALPPGSLL